MIMYVIITTLSNTKVGIQEILYQSKLLFIENVQFAEAVVE